MDHANLKELISLDLDASDNLTEEMIYSFVSSHGLHLQGRHNGELKEQGVSNNEFRIFYSQL